MSRLPQTIRTSLRRQLLPSAAYQGNSGMVWFAGFEPRAPSIAAFFCGDGVRSGRRSRVWRPSVPGRVKKIASAGGLPIVELSEPHSKLAGLLQGAVGVPSLVDIHTNLPDNIEALRAQLLTSTTREDFRRIRKANFTYRVTRDPAGIREFHARHYAPLVANQFPDDGRVGSDRVLLDALDKGGELICADIDGDWVAGIFNVPDEASYALMHLGIRDADNAVRQKRVVAALIVRSLERAVELGHHRATLGRSLPFLGKGPVWFKAKWNGVITRDPSIPDMHMFMDLRNVAVRRMLSASPVIHSEGDALVVSTWLDPDDQLLKATARDAEKFQGISRWYVLGEPETLAGGAEALSVSQRIIPVPVSPKEGEPIWLGDVLARRAALA